MPKQDTTKVVEERQVSVVDNTITDVNNLPVDDQKEKNKVNDSEVRSQEDIRNDGFLQELLKSPEEISFEKLPGNFQKFVKNLLALQEAVNKSMDENNDQDESEDIVFKLNFAAGSINIRGDDEQILLHSPDVQGALSFVNQNKSDFGLIVEGKKYTVLIKEQ